MGTTARGGARAGHRVESGDTRRFGFHRRLRACWTQGIDARWWRWRRFRSPGADWRTDWARSAVPHNPGRDPAPLAHEERPDWLASAQHSRSRRSAPSVGNDAIEPPTLSARDLHPQSPLEHRSGECPVDSGRRQAAEPTGSRTAGISATIRIPGRCGAGSRLNRHVLGGISPRQQIADWVRATGCPLPEPSRKPRPRRRSAVGSHHRTEADEKGDRRAAALMVALARGMLLENARWGWHPAAQLGASVDAPPQFLRQAAPHGTRDVVRHNGPGGRLIACGKR